MSINSTVKSVVKRLWLQLCEDWRWHYRLAADLWNECGRCGHIRRAHWGDIAGWDVVGVGCIQRVAGGICVCLQFKQQILRPILHTLIVLLSIGLTVWIVVYLFITLVWKE